MTEGEACGSCVQCPYCGHEFQTFANAESFSHMKCPQCSKWFHVHIKLGDNPKVYLNPDEFQEEIQETEGIFDEEAEASELLDD